MKFADLVEICLWPHLAVKGLNKSQCMDSSPPKKGGHCREVVVSGGSNVQEMIFMLFLLDITPLTEYLRFILPLKRSKKS